MIRSLRWRLQIWHAAILCVAIALFGTAFFVQLRRSTFSEIDLELLSGARVLEGMLRTLPPPALAADHPLMAPPKFDFRRASGPLDVALGPPVGPPVGPPDGSPGGLLGGQRGPAGRGGPSVGRGRFPDNRPAPSGNPARRADRRLEETGLGGRSPMSSEQRLENWLHLPQLPMRGPRDTPSYFAVFDRTGRLLQADPSDVLTSWTIPQRAIEYRGFNSHREVLLRGPAETLIIVGRDIHHHVDRLLSWLVQLIITGVSVLALGLVGGWWLSGKTIKPIHQISATAAKITATNLSERIETTGMDDELRALASILNSMLGRLDDSFKLQSQFTADASHELRTPLAVLMSHCELALNRPRSLEEYKLTIATCQKASLRMTTLVEDLLTLARADAGKLELECTAVDLQALARETIATLDSLAAANEVEIFCEGETVICQADSRRLSQVMANLISNAIHYNQSGGKVFVRTGHKPGFAVVEIEDTGCGIPTDAVSQLFDRFYRVDDDRSRQTGGSGLGLAICKSIIDAHAGSLTVVSQMRVGSTFTLRLPN